MNLRDFNFGTISFSQCIDNQFVRGGGVIVSIIVGVISVIIIIYFMSIFIFIYIYIHNYIYIP